MKSIRNTVMLGSLTISFPEMRRQAKDEAKKVEVDAGAKHGTLTANKHLMAGVEKHKAIKDYTALIRAWWVSVTLPWFDGKGGPRAVNALAVTDIDAELGAKARQYWALVDEFMPVYPNIRAQRQFEMGALFDDRQFPSPDELRRKFGFARAWYSLPNSDDIRVMEGVDAKELERIATQAAESERARLANAMETAAQRLHKVVQSMHETMATPIGEKGAKFNDSKLENILAVAELIPTLNLTNDPKLTALAKEAKKLALKSPGELREDAVKRANAAKEAETLAAKLRSMFTTSTAEDDE